MHLSIVDANPPCTLCRERLPIILCRPLGDTRLVYRLCKRCCDRHMAANEATKRQINDEIWAAAFLEYSAPAGAA